VTKSFTNKTVINRPNVVNPAANSVSCFKIIKLNQDHMLETTDKKIADLIESEYNPREITEIEFKKLQDSIQEFGFVEPVIVNKKNQIIGGHMRVRAAKVLGLTTVPCVTVDVEGDRAKVLNLALNRISGRWDTQKLGELITNLSSSNFDIKLSGFEDWELEHYNLGPNFTEKGLGDNKEDKKDEEQGKKRRCPECGYEW
jgi:hypothetical protein